MARVLLYGEILGRDWTATVSKLTKQGVRDLGNNTRRYPSALCWPHLPGDSQIVGYKFEGLFEVEPVFAVLCMKCGCRC